LERLDIACDEVARQIEDQKKKIQEKNEELTKIKEDYGVNLNYRP
jgi:peptidoglycan hydrolase CwlO-like protein